MSYPGPYLAGTPGWDNVHEYQATDDLQGGTGQIDNWQGQALMNRTEFLLNLASGFGAITTVAASSGTTPTLTAVQCKGNLVLLKVDTAAYMSATLPTVASMGVAAAANIQRQTSGGNLQPVTINAAGGDSFIDHNGIVATTLYLHANEGFTMIAIAATVWEITKFDGNYYNVGDQALGYVQKAGTLKRDGTIYNRADYPRLWSWAVANGLTVADGTWLVDAGGGANPRYPNKGLFSSGNGATTFRVPDDRGVFDRAMTYGAGVDTDRVSGGVGSAVGNVQGHQILTHNHTTTQTPHTHSVNDPGHNHSVNDPGHNHSVNDPGHAHGVNDPGHNHTTNIKTLPQAGSSTQCLTTNPAGTPGTEVSNPATTGIGVNISTTGVSNNANGTGVSNNASGTGVSNNAASIAITVNSNGGTETRPVNVAKHPLIVY